MVYVLYSLVTEHRKKELKEERFKIHYSYEFPVLQNTHYTSKNPEMDLPSNEYN